MTPTEPVARDAIEALILQWWNDIGEPDYPDEADTHKLLAERIIEWLRPQSDLVEQLRAENAAAASPEQGIFGRLAATHPPDAK